MRRGVRLVPVLTGGRHERGRRAGTENVAGIAGAGVAAALAIEKMADEGTRLAALRDRLEQEVVRAVPGTAINAAGSPRVPNTTNISFERTEAESLLIALDLEGICVSSGAACASGTLTPSHVLLAMGLTPARAHSSLRFSLGPGATEAEVARVVDALTTHVPRARALNLE